MLILASVRESRLAADLSAGHEPFDHGDNKCGRLPRTGLCTTDDIAALKGGWNGLSLNGSGDHKKPAAVKSRKSGSERPRVQKLV